MWDWRHAPQQYVNTVPCHCYGKEAVILVMFHTYSAALECHTSSRLTQLRDQLTVPAQLIQYNKRGGVCLSQFSHRYIMKTILWLSKISTFKTYFMTYLHDAIINTVCTIKWEKNSFHLYKYLYKIRINLLEKLWKQPT